MDPPSFKYEWPLSKYGLNNMREPDPEIVTSAMSGTFTRGGVTVQVHIIRLENEKEWTLEVVNSEGTSTVWDQPFENDVDAYSAFERVVAEEGMGAFDGSSLPEASNVIPFRRPQ